MANKNDLNSNNIIGIDVGGTNTDAVRLCGDRIAGWTKLPTTPDIETGILAALVQVCENKPIERIHIGTTAFTNALIERRGIESAAAIRIGYPVSESLPPMIDWPEDLCAAVNNPVFFIQGGREYNGRVIRKLDPNEIKHIATSLATSKVSQVAVTSVFGASYPEDELQVAEWLKAEIPDLGISLSHQIGRFGILERENATLINAMLRPIASRTIAAYPSKISNSLFISQNDGTTMRAQQAADLPVFSIASGPTNSLRGASVMTGLNNGIVFDIGGTTTDVGRLRNSFPQVASLELEVAGIRTNFRMPDLCSVGIGGGSIINAETGMVGPKSVGFKLNEEALVFGGSTLTLTDVAVAAGRVDVGDSSLVKDLDTKLIDRVDAYLRSCFEQLLENFERPDEHLPVILVGGGALLVNHIFSNNSRQVIQPCQANVANAFGAAIAQVSGDVDLTFSLDALSRPEALKRAESEARCRAVAAGARPDSIRIIELEDSAFSYLASDGLHVRAKAVGDLEKAK